MQISMFKLQHSGCLRVVRLRGDAAARPVTAHVRSRKVKALVAVASPPAVPRANAANYEAPSGAGAASLLAAPAASAFLDLGVDPMLVDMLPDIDVTRPSPIQSAALPAILSGANCALQSYTGSGKTLSYLLPTLTLALQRAEAMAADPASPRRGGLPDVPIQALVVAPSQELAMQIVRVAKSLLPPDVRRYAVQQVIGGANPKRQAEALAMMPGPLLVVGTPGRLAEMMRTGALRLHQCPMLVLDEADQLLASAFTEDVGHINDHCGKRIGPKAAPNAAYDGGATARRQTVLVSATLTPSVLSRSARWCPDPRFVSAGAVPALAAAPPTTAAKSEDAENPAWGWGVRGWDGPASPLAPKTRGSAGGVEGGELIPTMPPQLLHYYLVAEPRHKVDTLRRAIHALEVQRALVFMNFQQRLQDAQFKLQARGMKAAALHGELPRLTRSNLLNDFRRGRLRALVVSDVAARGIDVPACDAVFHLELPSSAAHYAHRAGRTGRLSAAMAAQQAAEAAEAAAAAAAESGSEAGSAPPAMATDAFIEQAAGTVVTVVTPSERFVVDKLAQQLGVPLLEAHVSHGKFLLGPPPAGYSFTRDEESDRTADAGPRGRDGAQPPRRERKAGATAADVGRRDAGVEASTSGRTRGGASATTQSTRPESGAAPAGAARGARAKESKYDILEDEDDDIILDDDDYHAGDDHDYEIVDEDLEAFKRLRPAQLRQLSTAAAAGGGGAAGEAAGIQLKGKRKQRTILPSLDPARDGSSAGRPAAGRGPPGRAHGREDGPRQARKQQDGERPHGSSRAEVMEELRRELAELKADKDKAKKQGQWQGRTGKGE